MIFYVEDGATISAISNIDLWPLDPPFPSFGGSWPHHTGFLGGNNITNVSITGQGMGSVIDGQGEFWWEKRRNNTLKYGPGHLIEFMYSTDIRLMNIKLIGSPSWNTHFYDCDTVHVKEVHIVEPESAPFVDGFDPDSSRNVLIEDSTYTGGDDCVAIKSGYDCFGIAYGKPSVNITVRNLTCHGFSAGIALGSEMSGGIENVTIENIRFTKANKPADIKVSKRRGGYIRNVIFRDITVTGTIQRAIHVDMFHYNDSPNPECPKDWEPPALTSISNLTFLRFDGRNASYVDYQHRPNETFHFYAYTESPIRNVYMEDLYFPDNEYGTNWNCNAVEGVVVNNTVQPWPPCSGFSIRERRQHKNPYDAAHEMYTFPTTRLYFGFVVALLLLVAWTVCWQRTRARCGRRILKEPLSKSLCAVINVPHT
ncbi:hypothetical protein ACA910_016943 [Epithemia clementina (nom. ined.)]